MSLTDHGPHIYGRYYWCVKRGAQPEVYVHADPTGTGWICTECHEPINGHTRLMFGRYANDRPRICPPCMLDRLSIIECVTIEDLAIMCEGFADGDPEKRKTLLRWAVATAIEDLPNLYESLEESGPVHAAN